MDNSSRKFDSTLTCDADLTDMWRTIIQPLGWDEHRLYLMFVDHVRTVLPQILQIDEMPANLDLADARQFASSFRHIVGTLGCGSVAVLVVRPGRGGPSDVDRATCRHLYQAAREAGLALEVIHVGTDTSITPAPMDEVSPRRAS
jgi:hypothetical protein